MQQLTGKAVAPGYPAGHGRYQMVADDFGRDSDTYAGPSDHLCNFTTGSPGVLTLHLVLWSDYPKEQSIVDMGAQRGFRVTESITEDPI